MAEIDRALVSEIADAVMAALRERAGAGASGGGEPVRVRPPAGVCTGDYSKFPELAGRLASAGPGAGRGNVAGDSSSSGAGGAEPLAGIVTARQLEAAAAEAPGGVAPVEAAARLTPLASDWAREHPGRVRRVERAGTYGAGTYGAGGAGGAAGGAAAPAWLGWMEGDCPAARRIIEDRRDRMKPLAGSGGAGAGASGLAGVLRELAGRFSSGRAHGAVLWVPRAARAMCLAGRCRSIRPVLGTCPESVEQGVTELGANLLVIEYPYQGGVAMAGMVDRFMERPPSLPPEAARELEAMHRCA